MIILNRKSHFKRFFFNNNLDIKVVIAINYTKYNNDKLSFYQLKYFNKRIYKNKKKYKNTYNRWYIQLHL